MSNEMIEDVEKMIEVAETKSDELAPVIVAPSSQEEIDDYLFKTSNVHYMDSVEAIMEKDIQVKPSPMDRKFFFDFDAERHAEVINDITKIDLTDNIVDDPSARVSRIESLLDHSKEVVPNVVAFMSNYGLPQEDAILQEIIVQQVLGFPGMLEDGDGIRGNFKVALVRTVNDNYKLQFSITEGVSLFLGEEKFETNSTTVVSTANEIAITNNSVFDEFIFNYMLKHDLLAQDFCLPLSESTINAFAFRRANDSVVAKALQKFTESNRKDQSLLQTFTNTTYDKGSCCYAFCNCKCFEYCKCCESDCWKCPKCNCWECPKCECPKWDCWKCPSCPTCCNSQTTCCNSQVCCVWRTPTTHTTTTTIRTIIKPSLKSVSKMLKDYAFDRYDLGNVEPERMGLLPNHVELQAENRQGNYVPWEVTKDKEDTVGIRIFYRDNRSCNPNHTWPDDHLHANKICTLILSPLDSTNSTHDAARSFASAISRVLEHKYTAKWHMCDYDSLIYRDPKFNPQSLAASTKANMIFGKTNNFNSGSTTKASGGGNSTMEANMNYSSTVEGVAFNEASYTSRLYCTNCYSIASCLSCFFCSSSKETKKN